MKADLHLHSKFSPDGHIDLAELASRAVNLGYFQVFITDHVDPPDDPYTPFNPAKFRRCRKEIARLRERYPSLDIRFGAEVGEFHLHAGYVREQFARCPPELVIASIHVVTGVNVSVPMPAPPTLELARAYYDENLAMLEIPGIDVLGHLGIYKRYLPNGFDDSACNPLIDRILTTIIRLGIRLEVNTSGLRRPLGELIPGPDVLRRYRELGGSYITLGSDSHVIDHFDLCFDEAVTRLHELGFYSLQIRDGDDWIAMTL
jgi:histidinol-phosphatase (PHP family)